MHNHTPKIRVFRVHSGMHTQRRSTRKHCNQDYLGRSDKSLWVQTEQCHDSNPTQQLTIQHGEKTSQDEACLVFRSHFGLGKSAVPFVPSPKLCGIAASPGVRHMASSSRPAESVEDLVVRLSSPHQCLSVADADGLGNLVEVCKAFMLKRAKNFVASAENRPLLLTYGSDGTPMMTREHWRHKSSGSLSVHRHGGSSHEYLIQRAFFAYRKDGALCMCTLFTEPLPLVNGKAAEQIFACGRTFFPTLRGCGHMGLALSHMCFDRAGFSALARLFKQFHAVTYEPGFLPFEDDGQRSLAQATDWFLPTPCCNHDAHNSLKWALSKYVLKEVSSDLFIIIESLRNSFDLLMGRLYSWASSRVCFSQREGTVDEHYQWWVLLGVDSEFATTMAELGLHFRFGRFHVDVDRQHDDDLFGTVTGCIMHMWRFRKFSDSRWLTLGESCKTLIGALHLGLAEMVDEVRKDPTTSDYYIHGFQRLTEELRRFAAVAAVGSCVAQGVLSSLVEDDRVARQLSFLESTVQEELEWVTELVGDFSWQQLAAVVGEGCSVHDLRTEIILASFTSAAFLRRKIFVPAKQLPWSLVTGEGVDVELQKLQESNEAMVDPTAAKIRSLALVGYNRHELKQAIELLLDIRWSTSVVEQGHRSATIVRQLHKTLGKDMLMMRSYLHMLKPLFTVDRPRWSVVVAQRKADRLAGAQPNKTTARHVLLKELFHAASAKLLPGAQLPKEQVEEIMRCHGQVFRSLPVADKLVLQRIAQQLRSGAAHTIEEDMQHLRSFLSLVTQRANAEQTSDKILSVSNCRLSPAEKEQLQDFFNSKPLRPVEVETLRQRVLSGPRPVPDKVSVAMDKVARDRQRDEGVQVVPSWVRVICLARDDLRGCAFGFSEGIEVHWYLLLFATQSPYALAFMPLQRSGTEPMPVVRTMEEFWTYAEKKMDYEFSFELGQFCEAEDMPFGSDAEVLVLPGVIVLGSDCAASHASPFSLSVIAKAQAAQPPRKRQAATGKASGASKASAQLLAENPWLAHFFEHEKPSAQATQAHGSAKRKIDRISLEDERRGKPTSSASGSASSSSMAPQDATTTGEEATDELLDSVWERLQEKRREWVQEEKGPLVEAFVVKLMGGAWTKANLGVDYDAFRGVARKGAPADWCKRYSFSQSAHFAIAKFGESNAHNLAKAWCDRLNFLYNAFEEQGCGDSAFQYTEATLKAYAEPEGIAVWAQTLGKNEPAAKRLVQIREMVPKSG